MLRFALFLIACVGFPHVRSVSVVEFYPTLNETTNLAKYLEIIDNHTGDLIVFPEATLSETPVYVGSNLSNCSRFANGTFNGTFDFAQDVVNLLGCTANFKNSTIVVNLSERVNCTNCGPRGNLLYNTNVVLGKNGTILKYRKFNLFGEAGTNITEKAEIVSWDSEVGKTGIFTCFDVLFAQPALNLTKQGVQNIVYPTMWYSELPFLTALQAQHMFAHGQNVNFYSAGANSFKVGNGGSGIFLKGQGFVNATLNPDLKSGDYEVLSLAQNTTVPQSTNVEIDKMAAKLDKLYLLKDDLSNYNSQLLNQTQRKINTTLCDNSRQLCCSFDVTLANSSGNHTNNSYIYRFVAFSGVRSFGGFRNGSVQVCGIVACTDDKTVKSCNHRFANYTSVTWPLTFESIQIKATFENSDKKLQFPNSLLSHLRPVSPQFTTWNRTVVGKTVEVQFALIKAQSRLQTFAIYGRDYGKDAPVAPSSATTATFYYCLLITSVLALIKMM